MRTFLKQEPRVETGPVQFGDDWPGVFIRGDNAMHYAMILKSLYIIDEFKTEPATSFAHPIYRKVIEGLISDLESCNMHKEPALDETTLRKTI